MISFIAENFDPTANIDVRIEVLSAPDFAAYKQALDAVIDAAPDRLVYVLGNPITDLDEVVIAFANAVSTAAFREGVRAVFTWAGGEAARPTEQLCNTCSGHGRVRDPEVRTCPTCDGDGTVPTVVA